MKHMRLLGFPKNIHATYLFSNKPHYYPQKYIQLQLAYNPKPMVPFLTSFFSTGSSPKMTYPIQKSDDEWQAILSKEQFHVLRRQGTEAPFTGKYDNHMPEEGVYTCGGCDAPLYKASHKFKSGCGWPAYFDSIPGAVTRHSDNSMGISRTEIVCSNCGGHLGHVFKGEGYNTPTNERHCVNSISIKFSPEDPVLKDSKA